jgi:hypothetical protein
MDGITRTNLAALYSPDAQVQNQAFSAILAATAQPVDWAYEIWEDLLAALGCCIILIAARPAGLRNNRAEDLLP